AMGGTQGRAPSVTRPRPHVHVDGIGSGARLGNNGTDLASVHSGGRLTPWLGPLRGGGMSRCWRAMSAHHDGNGDPASTGGSYVLAQPVGSARASSAIAVRITRLLRVLSAQVCPMAIAGSRDESAGPASRGI